MVKIFRTPDECFSDLPGFSYQPKYHQADELRLAYVDEGDGSPIVFLHGEPTWSFLWRKPINKLIENNYRCIAPDHIGFGRSDKPTDPDWYSYDRHTELTGKLLENLDLHDATLVLHDWGGPIGLRLAVEQSDRISAMVLIDTGVFTGEQQMSPIWQNFRDFVANSEELSISFLVESGCDRDLSPAEKAAYDAPFPNEESKAGARAFPQLVPTNSTAAGAKQGREVLAALRQDKRPMLIAWGKDDPALTVEIGEEFAGALGRDHPRIIENASHFVPEDKGDLLGSMINDWLTDIRR